LVCYVSSLQQVNWVSLSHRRIAR